MVDKFNNGVDIVSKGISGFLKGLGVHGGSMSAIGSTIEPVKKEPTQQRQAGEAAGDVDIDDFGSVDGQSMVDDAVREVVRSDANVEKDTLNAIKVLNKSFLTLTSYVNDGFVKIGRTFDAHAAAVTKISRSNQQIVKTYDALSDRLKVLELQHDLGSKKSVNDDLEKAALKKTLADLQKQLSEKSNDSGSGIGGLVGDVLKYKAIKTATTGLKTTATGLAEAGGRVAAAKGVLGTAARSSRVIGGALVGGAIEGGLEYYDTGNVGRAASVGGGAAVGGWGGAAAGAAIGTAILPGVGTIAGGLIGGIAGSMGGASIGRSGYDMIAGNSKIPTTEDAEKSVLTDNPDLEIEKRVITLTAKEILTLKATNEIKLDARSINIISEEITIDTKRFNFSSFALEALKVALNNEATKQNDVKPRGFWRSIGEGLGLVSRDTPEGEHVPGALEKIGRRMGLIGETGSGGGGGYRSHIPEVQGGPQEGPKGGSGVPNGYRDNPMAPAGSSIAPNSELQTITLPSGRKFTVSKEGAGNFELFLKNYEAAGGVISGSSGGIGTRGNASYHPKGDAIDVNQVGYGIRSRTGKTLPTEIEDYLAEQAGLFSGNKFRSADTGHFEIGSKKKAREALVRQGFTQDQNGQWIPPKDFKYGQLPKELLEKYPNFAAAAKKEQAEQADAFKEKSKNVPMSERSLFGLRKLVGGDNKDPLTAEKITGLPMGALKIQGAAGEVNRSKFHGELNDQTIRDRMITIALAETGGDPKSARMLMETIMNRADAQGKTLLTTMDPNYYAPFKDGGFARAQAKLINDPKLRAALEAELDRVKSGSNDSNLATDNASGNVAANARNRGDTITAMTPSKETLVRKDQNPNYHGAGIVQNTQKFVERVERERMEQQNNPQSEGSQYNPFDSLKAAPLNSGFVVETPKNETHAQAALRRMQQHQAAQENRPVDKLPEDWKKLTPTPEQKAETDKAWGDVDKQKKADGSYPITGNKVTAPIQHQSMDRNLQTIKKEYGGITSAPKHNSDAFGASPGDNGYGSGKSDPDNGGGICAI